MSFEERLSRLRAAGWAVVVHNDYRQGGESFTFWLFARAGRCVKGEGRTDAEAIARVEEALVDKCTLCAGTRVFKSFYPDGRMIPCPICVPESIGPRAPPPAITRTRDATRRGGPSTGRATRTRNPGAGCNATHVARGRRKWKRIRSRQERRRGEGRGQ